MPNIFLTNATDDIIRTNNSGKGKFIPTPIKSILGDLDPNSKDYSTRIKTILKKLNNIKSYPTPLAPIEQCFHNLNKGDGDTSKWRWLMTIVGLRYYLGISREILVDGKIVVEDRLKFEEINIHTQDDQHNFGKTILQNLPPDFNEEFINKIKVILFDGEPIGLTSEKTIYAPAAGIRSKYIPFPFGDPSDFYKEQKDVDSLKIMGAWLQKLLSEKFNMIDDNNIVKKEFTRWKNDVIAKLPENNRNFPTLNLDETENPKYTYYDNINFIGKDFKILSSTNNFGENKCHLEVAIQNFKLLGKQTDGNPKKMIAIGEYPNQGDVQVNEWVQIKNGVWCKINDDLRKYVEVYFKNNNFEIIDKTIFSDYLVKVDNYFETAKYQDSYKYLKEDTTNELFAFPVAIDINDKKKLNTIMSIIAQCASEIEKAKDKKSYNVTLKILTKGGIDCEIEKTFINNSILYSPNNTALMAVWPPKKITKESFTYTHFSFYPAKDQFRIEPVFLESDCPSNFTFIDDELNISQNQQGNYSIGTFNDAVNQINKVWYETNEYARLYKVIVKEGYNDKFGYFIYNPKEVDNNLKPVDVSVDFGSSHTAVFYKEGNNPIQRLKMKFQVKAVFGNVNEPLITNGLRYNILTRAPYGEATYELDLLQTQLFTPVQGALSENLYKEMFRGYVFPEFLKGQTTNEYSNIRTNIKWDGRDGNQWDKTKFIHSLFNLIKVNLADKGMKITNLKYAFPSSYQADTITQINNAWNSVNNVALNKTTESIANFQYIKSLTGEITERQFAVVFDIGGSTTDLSLFYNSKNEMKIHSESFKLSANVANIFVGLNKDNYFDTFLKRLETDITHFSDLQVGDKFIDEINKIINSYQADFIRQKRFRSWIFNQLILDFKNDQNKSNQFQYYIEHGQGENHQPIKLKFLYFIYFTYLSIVYYAGLVFNKSLSNSLVIPESKVIKLFFHGLGSNYFLWLRSIDDNLDENIKNIFLKGLNPTNHNISVEIVFGDKNYKQEVGRGLLSQTVEYLDPNIWINCNPNNWNAPNVANDNDYKVYASDNNWENLPVDKKLKLDDLNNLKVNVNYYQTQSPFKDFIDYAFNQINNPVLNSAFNSIISSKSESYIRGKLQSILDNYPVTRVESLFIKAMRAYLAILLNSNFQVINPECEELLD